MRLAILEKHSLSRLLINGSGCKEVVILTLLVLLVLDNRSLLYPLDGAFQTSYQRLILVLVAAQLFYSQQMSQPIPTSLI